MSPALFERADYHLYTALALAAISDGASAAKRGKYRRALREHHQQLLEWAETCPENFASRATLVGAEIARLDGRELDAERLYEQAIGSARASGFPHDEAIANERASRFHAVRGFEKLARIYLLEARRSYQQWGADGKVRQLDHVHSHPEEQVRAPVPTSTIGAPVEHLDLATIIKISQAVSGEIFLEKLIETILRTALQHAGAERGLLILCRKSEPYLAAEATNRGNAILVQLCDEPVTASSMPQSLYHYVVRTADSVILDDALADDHFSEDSYIGQHQARSILCLPLLNRATLIGVLYLENNLTPRVFSPARLPVLKLVASQAATALENGRLYHDLAERETRIRRLVEANIVGIFFWDFEGEILDANDAFLRMLGYDRQDLEEGRIRWTTMTPSELQSADQRGLEEIRLTGSCKPYEKVFLRRDGTRLPVLLGGTTFEHSRNQGVAFVLDLTERKRAEAEARDSERRLREVHAELAHANRVTTLGQLTASIAHEVKQPLAAVVTAGHAGLRWLARDPPNLDKVQSAFQRIIDYADGATDVISRIRTLVNRQATRPETLDVNRAVREVIALANGEVVKTGVTVLPQLADPLPSVQGDRVQLQQVILNLIINAIQAMADLTEGSRDLTVSTEVHEDAVCVSVKDTGPGLSSESLRNLFQPFHTTKPDGMGIGLSICRSIVEDHGGRLWVSANTPQGAVFQFTIPRGDRAASDESDGLRAGVEGHLVR
jgi:PAS domain S-box-containing protein